MMIRYDYEVERERESRKKKRKREKMEGIGKKMKRKGKMAQTEIWGGRKSGGGDGIFKGRPQLVIVWMESPSPCTK